MSDVFRWYLGGLLATAAEFALLVAPTVNSYKRFLPGSWAPTGDRLGGRQPNARLPRRRPRAGDARREPHPGCRRQLLPRVRGDDRRRSARHRRAHRAAAAVRRQRLRATDLPRIPATFVEAIELWRDERRRPGRASATTSTTTCCTSPRRSGRRSTARSPTGSGAATSSASDRPPAPPARAPQSGRRQSHPRSGRRRSRFRDRGHPEAKGARDASELRWSAGVADGLAVRAGAPAGGVDRRAVEDRLGRRDDDLAVAVAGGRGAVDDEAEAVRRWPAARRASPSGGSPRWPASACRRRRS